jgi:uncharacterized protein
MTPQERQLVDDLFDRLSKVESAPRDPDAASAIAQGLQVAPNAVYALVQTVLVQDEALKRASIRIQELEAAGAPAQNQSGGFLDSMRDTISGQGHGSVPNVRPPEIPNRPTWNSGQVLQQAQGSGQYRDESDHQDQYRQDQYRQDRYPQDQYRQDQYRQDRYPQDQYRQDQYRQEPYGSSFGAAQSPMGGGGGSFLGTAAAAAAGAVGGSLLMNSIRSMMGGSGSGSHHSLADQAGLGGKPATQNPWSDQSGSSMARDAGLNDIGSSAKHTDDNSRSGLLDTASKDNDHDDMDLDSDDDGDSDYA